jgi:hemolysin III
MLKDLREPVNGLTHFVAAWFAFAGVIALIILSRGDLARQRSLIVYGSSLVLMFSASAAYHSIKGSPERIQRLRRIDHAAIFILIAGTYTPIAFNQLTGFWRWGMLSIIWTFALLGIITKVFWIDAPRWLTTGTYLLMGWMSVGAVGPMMEVLPMGAIIWLLVGGLFYSFGAIVYATKSLDLIPGVFGSHEIWHLFVIGGAFCHFVMILVYIAPLARIP